MVSIKAFKFKLKYNYMDIGHTCLSTITSHGLCSLQSNAFLRYISLMSHINASNWYVLYTKTLLMFYRSMLYMFYWFKSYIYSNKCSGEEWTFLDSSFTSHLHLFSTFTFFKPLHVSGISTANAAIISFSFVNIRYRLYVLLTLGIFEILFSTNDLLWP